MRSRSPCLAARSGPTPALRPSPSESRRVAIELTARLRLAGCITFEFERCFVVGTYVQNSGENRKVRLCPHSLASSHADLASLLHPASCRLVAVHAQALSLEYRLLPISL